MGEILDELADKPCIYTKDNMVNEINNQFLELTGYTSNEIVGKSLEDVSVLLRNKGQQAIQDIKEAETLYIFTKDDCPLAVRISCENLGATNYKGYYFENEIDPLLQTMQGNLDNIYINPNESVAIYSYPGCILLSHNEKYTKNLKRLNIKSSDIIGRHPSFANGVLKKFGTSNYFFLDEAKLIEPSGITSYWNTRGKIICGQTDRKYFLISFYEVTERVQKRDVVEKQKEDVTLILENITDSVNIINLKGEYIYANKTSREKTAYYSKDVQTRTSEMDYGAFTLNDINGKQLSFKDSPNQRVLRGEVISNLYLVGTSHLPTTYHQCDGRPIYDEEGNIKGGILVYRDMKNTLKAEEYSTFQDIAKNISICYAILSPDNLKIRHINEFGFECFKRRIPHLNSESDIIGKNFFDYYQVNDKNISRNIQEAINNHSSYSDKQKFVTSGILKYAKTIFQPAYNIKGEVEKIFVIGVDISDEEIARREMKKALKAQEEMFINSSHELKTPLNVIFSAAQLLAIDLQSDSIEAMKPSMEISNKMIVQNCYRMTKLINNILDISKIESGLYELNLADYNMIDFIDDIVESVAPHVRMQGLEIIFDTEIEDYMIGIDVDKFEKVLLNLISNAIKFSNSGGVIMINLTEKDGAIEISVEDQGIGIDREDYDVVFEKFKQVNTSLSRRSEGTGIGLPLVKSIVELHNGYVNLESALGQGSKFTIGLPGKVVDIKSTMGQELFKRSRDERVRLELSDIYA